jgi:hypothetical protein
VYDSLAQLCINEPGNDFIRGDLVKLFSHLHALLRDTRWQHIADDPDYDLIYDGLSDIHDDIIK